jgi:hypothetical protein
MKKPEKTADGIEFFSQYEKYIQGRISYRELHHLGSSTPGAPPDEKVVALTATRVSGDQSPK